MKIDSSGSYICYINYSSTSATNYNYSTTNIVWNFDKCNKETYYALEEARNHTILKTYYTIDSFFDELNDQVDYHITK